MPPCEASHLLQPLDRHQRGQWLALPLNDKLVVTKGDPVEQVTDPLANLDCGYFFPSVATSIVALDAGPQGASKSLSRFLP